jgi:uncharacterized protein YkwD/LysM repeat protein
MRYLLKRYNTRMKNSYQQLLLLFLALPILLHGKYTGTRNFDASPTPSISSEVIQEINKVRAANGLNPYRADPILMGIAQVQSDYMASIGTWTHTGANGSRPYQRALEAGYLIAGDLTLGGRFSENVWMENNLAPKDVVQRWLDDPNDQYAVLSESYEDAGVGLAIIDNTYYYCLDVGLSTHGTPVAYTPPGPTPTATIVQSTPESDGSIIHIVQVGDTLLAISLAYDISLSDILSLNGLSIDAVIYPNERIIIRPAFTPTPTVPTLTASRIPTSTPWPSSTPTPLATTSDHPTSIPKAEISENKGLTIAGVIIFLALIVGGVTSIIGKRRK